jgi:excisionase family DNA binding protein
MNPEQQKTELLTVPEAAEVLRLRPSTIRAWLQKDRLSSVRLGSRVFIPMTECLRVIQAGFRPAVGQGGTA